MQKITKATLDSFVRANFQYKELCCKCCQQLPINSRGDLVLDKVQAMSYIVQEPLVVTCFYRCPVHNLEVGGEIGSLHQYLAAIDFKFNNSKQLWTIVTAAIAVGFNQIQINPVKGYVHCALSTDNNFSDVLSIKLK